MWVSREFQTTLVGALVHRNETALVLPPDQQTAAERNAAPAEEGAGYARCEDVTIVITGSMRSDAKYIKAGGCDGGRGGTQRAGCLLYIYWR